MQTSELRKQDAVRKDVPSGGKTATLSATKQPAKQRKRPTNSICDSSSDEDGETSSDSSSSAFSSLSTLKKRPKTWKSKSSCPSSVAKKPKCIKNKERTSSLSSISASSESSLSSSSSSEEDSSTASESSTNSAANFEARDRWIAHLYRFMDERGTPINKAPSIANKDLNLYKLYKVSPVYIYEEMDENDLDSTSDEMRWPMMLQFHVYFLSSANRIGLFVNNCGTAWLVFSSCHPTKS